MKCGDCGGKGCCTSEEPESTGAQIKQDALFITFKIFSPGPNVAIFSLST
jgi:hypothetical protein